MADPGFSPGGAPTPKIAIIFHIFAENCMKMKEFGPPGGARVPGAPPWIRQCTTSKVCKISLSFRISLSDMTNYKSAFGKVCRIKNRQTFKSMPILNSAYHAVKYAELRIGILLKVCRFVIRHITTWYGMPN